MYAKASKQRLVIFGAQKALIAAAQKAGWHKEFGYWEKVRDFSVPLERNLPKGYHFASAPLDVAKCCECCWKGFGHEAEEGPWDGDTEYTGGLATAPHSTAHLDVAIENEDGEYVCYAGMWWTPENKLAYMEPLCTVPEHRRKGYAGQLVRHLQKLYQPRCKRMEVGTSPDNVGFYEKLGFAPAYVRENFFKDNYPEPIIENGTVLTDMHVLEKEL